MASGKNIRKWAGAFDGRLDVQPPLTDGQLAEIPAKRGVFLLTAEGEAPILLATAAGIRARLRGRLDEPDPERHKRSADLRTITRAIHWKLATGHFEMDWIYLELAKAIWPKTYAKLLSWRPAWFVHVGPAEAFPHFVRTRDVFATAGRYFGPFESGRSADQFIDAVQDAFDLCRDIQCLRRSPCGQPCPYGQMGRCLCPCDGSISMDAYRLMVAAATEFAAGPREPHVQGLKRQMASASAELEFERAATLKARLDRLAELEGPAYTHVAPAEKFQFLLAQPAGSRRKVKVFLVDRGAVAPPELLDWPLEKKQLARTLRKMMRFVAAGAKRPSDPVERWRVGLVARALFSSRPRKGLALRWTLDLTGEHLARAITASADALGLSRAAKARKAKAKGPKP